MRGLVIATVRRGEAAGTSTKVIADPPREEIILRLHGADGKRRNEDHRRGDAGEKKTRPGR
jgi:hypothetical protein